MEIIKIRLPWSNVQLLPLQGGHTAGSAALLLRNGAACVGDVLRGGHMGGALLPGRANIHYFAEDAARNRAELRGLVDAGVQTFHVGHGRPAAVQSVRARLLQLVISDRLVGLKSAISKALNRASWQRCRVHFMRNLLAHIPQRNESMVAALVHTAYAQPNRQVAGQQLAEMVKPMAQGG